MVKTIFLYVYNVQNKVFTLYYESLGSSPSYELTPENILLIKNTELFASTVIPNHFEHASFKSFEKQVI